MSSLPTISIVTPSFNQARYLSQAIASVSSQDYPKFDHIVIDGASQDGTLEILRRHDQLPHFRWISEPDSGQTEAINKGIRQCAGDIVAYLNADDVYRPGAFRAVAKAFAANSGCGVLVGDCDEIDRNSNVTRVHPVKLCCPQDLLRHWASGQDFRIDQPAVFLRRRLLDEAGLFDETFDVAMDYEMWLRLASRTRFAIVPQTLAAFRVTDETKSRRRPHDLVIESHRAARKHASLAPRSRRLQLALASRRETAGHLLTLAEHKIKRATGGPSPRRMAVNAFILRPIVCHSPRFWRVLLAHNS